MKYFEELKEEKRKEMREKYEMKNEEMKRIFEANAILEEKKKLLELESGRHEVEVGRLADLEKESKVLRLENKRLFGETRSLEEQCL